MPYNSTTEDSNKLIIVRSFPGKKGNHKETAERTGIYYCDGYVGKPCSAEFRILDILIRIRILWLVLRITDPDPNLFTSGFQDDANKNEFF
jgi:hypothetical protein